jgi:hypothetical protein
MALPGISWLIRAGVTTGEVEMAHDMVADQDQAANPTPCHGFRISDAMILLAGVAVALSAGCHLLVLLADMLARLSREAMAHREDLITHWPVFWSATHDSLRNTLWYGFQVAEMFLFCLTPAFFILRLRRPRPPLRALLRQPGTVAALAMIFGLFWGTGSLLALVPAQVDSMTAAPAAIGGAVAAGWGILALSRQWQAGRGWIDRLGRILGCLAIGTALLGLLIHRI